MFLFRSPNVLFATIVISVVISVCLFIPHYCFFLIYPWLYYVFVHYVVTYNCIAMCL
jgi:hypothetical protein